MGYWLDRANCGDPRYVEDEGRLFPTVKVRNDAEYAAVAAGQVVATDAFIHWILIPIWVVTLFLFMCIPAGFDDLLFRVSDHMRQVPGTAQVVTLVGSFLLWAYFIFYRSIKAAWKVSPKVGFADEYHGMLDHTNKYKAYKAQQQAQPQPPLRVESEIIDMPEPSSTTQPGVLLTRRML